MWLSASTSTFRQNRGTRGGALLYPPYRRGAAGGVAGTGLLRRDRRIFLCWVRCDAIVICVPTPLDAPTRAGPDLRGETTRAVAATLRPGQLVVLESTTYPGTTREVFEPILEAGGLRSGRDFFLAYQPEREDPGNADFATRDHPQGRRR